MPGSSAKKADVIIKLRPYVNWRDALVKFQSEKTISADLLNAAEETLNIQRDIVRLMSKCETISRTLEVT